MAGFNFCWLLLLGLRVGPHQVIRGRAGPLLHALLLAAWGGALLVAGGVGEVLLQAGSLPGWVPLPGGREIRRVPPPPLLRSRPL